MLIAPTNQYSMKPNGVRDSWRGHDSHRDLGSLHTFISILPFSQVIPQLENTTQSHVGQKLSYAGNIGRLSRYCGVSIPQHVVFSIPEKLGIPCSFSATRY